MIDRLIEDIEAKKNPTVVGLDPTLEMMPEHLVEKYLGDKDPEAREDGNKTESVILNIAGKGSQERAVMRNVADMFVEFNKGIIDAVADIVPAVKPQIAMYEKFGTEGIRAYNETCSYASEAGLTVIGDIKRGDISSTAAAYAAHLGGAEVGGRVYDTWIEDAVTVNPYMGSDGIRQFKEECEKRRKGMFILLKTSNPSSSEIQDLVLGDGRTVYEAVADLIDEWGSDLIGRYGFSELGAVVGATHREQGEKLRREHPYMFFLVPGYGAQGATAEDVAGFFDKKHRGAIINSSRGITSAYRKEGRAGNEFADAAREAALRMRDQLRAAIGME